MADRLIVVRTEADQIRGFKLVPCREEPESTMEDRHALAQGQSMVNFGEETLFYYEIRGASGVRMASWQRDRLGYYQVSRGDVGPHCLSCPIRIDASGAKVYANVDGLSEHSQVTVDLLDERLRPPPGYSGDGSVPIGSSGPRQSVAWKGRDVVRGIDVPIRLKVGFGGLRPEDAKLYALYVTGVER